MKKEKIRQKGSKAVTAVFYLCYFLLIAGYFTGMYFLRSWLTDELVLFEASTQPGVRAEEIFQELFTDPDWSQLYVDAGLEDTSFENQDAFLAYIAANVDENALTYQETDDPSHSHKFLVLTKDQTLGYFTLTNQAGTKALIPDWQLGEIGFFLPRNLSVTVEKQDDHTVYVNGHPLDDSYTVEILSTTAEQFLPAGTPGIRRIRQEVTGLLMQPEITVLDGSGNSCELRYDEDTGMYTEVLPSAEPITKELKEAALTAGEVYCTYMVEQDNYQLFQYFASGTETYQAITSATPWPQNAMETEITDPRISDYVRYTEDLFSVRVAMDMKFIFGEKNIRTRSLDSILFFENRKDGWMVIAMTNDDITLPTSRVRLTFMSGDTPLSTIFCDSTGAEVYAPQLTAPEGQMLSGWAERVVSPDGSFTLNPIFSADEYGNCTIPQGTVLKPMTLYPLFDDIVAVG